MARFSVKVTDNTTSAVLIEVQIDRIKTVAIVELLGLRKLAENILGDNLPDK